MTLAAADPLALLRRRQQCAQTGEAVGGHGPERDQFGERVLDLRAQQVRAVDDFVVERSAVRTQEFRDCLRARTHRRLVPVGARRDACPQRRAAPRQQRHRRRANDVRAAGDAGGCRQREARPHGTAGKAEVVEPREIVVLEARRQNFRFPRAAGASKPCNCAMIASSASGPWRCSSGVTCCQRKRNRTKSCVATGSISWRRRFTV